MGPHFFTRLPEQPGFCDFLGNFRKLSTTTKPENSSEFLGTVYFVIFHFKMVPQITRYNLPFLLYISHISIVYMGQNIYRFYVLILKWPPDVTRYKFPATPITLMWYFLDVHKTTLFFWCTIIVCVQKNSFLGVQKKDIFFTFPTFMWTDCR